jgi:hypothetical protein
MLAIHSALWGSTGSWEMFVFHTLSAGNIGQLGAPGSGVPAAAGGVATNAVAALSIPVTITMAKTARWVARTARVVIPSFPTFPDATVHSQCPRRRFRRPSPGAQSWDARPMRGARR